MKKDITKSIIASGTVSFISLLRSYHTFPFVRLVSDASNSVADDQCVYYPEWVIPVSEMSIYGEEVSFWHIIVN